jgi:hypothetical protein
MNINILKKYVIKKDINNVCKLLVQEHDLYGKKCDYVNEYINTLISAIDLIYETDKSKLTNNICNSTIMTFIRTNNGIYGTDGVMRVKKSITDKLISSPLFVFDYKNLVYLKYIRNDNAKGILNKILIHFFKNKENLIKSFNYLRYSMINFSQYYDVNILDIDDFIKIQYFSGNDIIKYLSNKVTIDKIHLFVNTILRTNDFQLLKNLCEKYSIEFTIDNLIFSCDPIINIDIMEFVLLRKVIPNSACFNNVIDSNNSNTHIKVLKIKMLLCFGYCPTQIDIEKAYSLGVPIEDFEKYDIKFNSKMFWYCCEFKISNKYTKSFVPTQKDFQDIFLHEELTMYKIKRYKKVKLDINCLRNACSLKHNTRIINYIINQDINPDMECVKNAVHTESGSCLCDPIIKKFDELYPNITNIDDIIPKDKLIFFNGTFRCSIELFELVKKK